MIASSYCLSDDREMKIGVGLQGDIARTARRAQSQEEESKGPTLKPRLWKDSGLYALELNC